MFNSVNLLRAQGFVSVTLPNFFVITIPGKFQRARISVSNAFLKANRIHQLAFVLLSISTVFLFYRLGNWTWKVCYKSPANSSPLTNPISKPKSSPGSMTAVAKPISSNPPESELKVASTAEPSSPASLNTVYLGSQVDASTSVSPLPHAAQKPATVIPKPAPEAVITSPISPSSVNPQEGVPAEARSRPASAPKLAVPTPATKVASTAEPSSPASLNTVYLGSQADAPTSVSPLPHAAQKPATVILKPAPEAVITSPISPSSVNPQEGVPAEARLKPASAPKSTEVAPEVAPTIEPTSPRSESLAAHAEAVVKTPPLPPTAAKPPLKSAASKRMPGSSSVSSVTSSPINIQNQESDSSSSSEDDEIVDLGSNTSSLAATSSVTVKEGARRKKPKFAKIKIPFIDGRSREEKRSDAFERLVKLALEMPNSAFYPEGIIRTPVSAQDKKMWKKYLLRKKADETSKRLQKIDLDMIISVIKDYIKEMALFAGEDLQLGQGQQVDGIKVKVLVNKLEDRQRQHLKLFLAVLCRVSEFADTNKMTMRNIALSINDLLSPIPKTVVEQQEILDQGKKVVAFTEYLLIHYEEVFPEILTGML